jgi:hypothetical protein
MEIPKVKVWQNECPQLDVQPVVSNAQTNIILFKIDFSTASRDSTIGSD